MELRFEDENDPTHFATRDNQSLAKSSDQPGKEGEIAGGFSHCQRVYTSFKVLLSIFNSNSNKNT